jgi:NADPH:quinone reductase-like Zn-dependent oxidoreductase
VLLQVHAAAVNRGTLHLMTGEPYLLRLGFGVRKPKNPVPGHDVAGTVVAIGPNVTRSFVDRPYPLAETPDAVRHLAAGKAAGKVVITV